MSSIEIIPTTQPPPQIPSPTLTNPDMILPAPHGSPDSPTTPTQRQRPPSLSSIRFRAQSGERVSDNKTQDDTASNGARVIRIRTKGRRSFGEHHSGDESRSEFRRGKLGKLRLNGASSSSSSSPVDSSTSTPVGEARAPTSQPNGTQWRKVMYGADHDSNVQQGFDFNASTPASEMEDYDFPKTEAKHMDGVITTVERGDPYSHAQQSIRAEQILQNAKKRLMAMEGNLNRARSKLGGRPSSSMSSFVDNDDDDDHPISSILSARRREITSPAKHRQNHTQMTSSDKGHIRVLSETSVPASLQSPSREDFQNVEEDEGIRDGHSGTNGSQGWHWGNSSSNQNHAQRHQNFLPALNEDEVAPAFDSSPMGSPESELYAPLSDQHHASRSLPNRSPSSGNLTRARSTTQMRDLREQVQDLKGKISNLKQRAREDSLRRRSMQSLRTSSPFTNAEDWYLGSPGDRKDQGDNVPKNGDIEGGDGRDELRQLREGTGRQLGSAETEPEMCDIGQKHVDTLHSFTKNSPQPEQVPLPADEDSPRETQATSPKLPSTPSTQNQLDPAIEASPEVEDSLYGDHDYHETSPHPTGELSHEDRADAFDYEHFILHSTMGSIGGQRSSSRSSSHSSMYSVETTKPTNNLDSQDLPISPRLLDDDDDISPKTISNSIKANGPPPTTHDTKKTHHARNMSVESTSTVATFATATEGAQSDETNLGSLPGNWNSRPHHHTAHLPSYNHFSSRAAPVPQQATRQRISKAPAPPAIVTSHRPIHSAGASPISPDEATPLVRRTISLRGQRVRDVKTTNNHRIGGGAGSPITPDSPTILSLLSALSPAMPDSTNNTTPTSSATTPNPAGAPHHPSSTSNSSPPPSKHPKSPPYQPINLSPADTEIVSRLVYSLAKVSRNLHIQTDNDDDNDNSGNSSSTAAMVGKNSNGFGNGNGSGSGEMRARGRQWRRRLDGARRVLDGEVNGEVF